MSSFGQANVRAVMTGHSHFDHIGDVPDIVTRLTPAATVYTNATGVDMLAAYPRIRTHAVDPDEGWIRIANSRIRLRAVAWDHAPQLCRLVDTPPGGPQWVHEVKFDGYRVMSRVRHRRAALLTRKGLDWTERFPEIARRMAISVEDVQKAADSIARLNPRPGQVFAAAPQNYVLPDVIVEKVDGEYQISFNNEQIPHLRISNLYKDIIASGDSQSSDAKDYIRDKIRSGKFLIRSIHQRQQTIINIAQQIVSRQRDFIEHGPSHLKPMTMAEVAEAVGVHETTVSRAVSGKYMATPQGVFEMKYFFTPGYQTAAGESMSSTSVKETILDLVKNEDGNAPLSDQEIVHILSERGIPIARRTVAKYRTELNLLPSNMRRKY